MIAAMDTSYLDVDSPLDREVRFYLDADEPEIVRVELDLTPAGAGTLRLRLGVDELLKLATRMFAVGKQAQGDLPSRGQPN